MVPTGGSDAVRSGFAGAFYRDPAPSSGIHFRTKGIARPRDNHATVLMIARNVHEGVRQFFMGRRAPFQLGIIGVERHLEDTITPLHLDCAVTAGVIVELDKSHQVASSIPLGAV